MYRAVPSKYAQICHQNDSKENIAKNGCQMIKIGKLHNQNISTSVIVATGRVCLIMPKNFLYSMIFYYIVLYSVTFYHIR